MVSDKMKRIIRVLSLSAVLLFIVIQFTQSIGLIARGFDSEEVLKQFFFYAAPAVGFLLGILLIFAIELFITKDDKKFGDSIAFGSQGQFPGVSFFKRFTTIQLTLLSAIIFSIVGFFATLVGQRSFTGVSLLPQQFTPASAISFSTALVVISENLGAAFFIAFMFLLLRYLGRKTNMSKTSFRIISWAIFPLIVGTVGLGNHLLRYAGQETSLLVVFFFWYLGGLITIAVQNVIPFLMMHASNNIFIDLNRFFASDVFVRNTWIVIGLMIVTYVIIYRKRLLGRKNES